MGTEPSLLSVGSDNQESGFIGEAWAVGGSGRTQVAHRVSLLSVSQGDSL